MYLLRMRGMLSLHVRPRVSHDLLLGVIGVVGPGFGAVRSATWWSPESLRSLGGSWYWPRRELLVPWAILDRLEAG